MTKAIILAAVFLAFSVAGYFIGPLLYSLDAKDRKRMNPDHRLLFAVGIGAGLTMVLLAVSLPGDID